MTTYCTTCSQDNISGQSCRSPDCPFPLPAVEVVAFEAPNTNLALAESGDASQAVLAAYKQICELPDVVAVSMAVQYENGENISLGKPAMPPGKAVQ